MVTSPQHCVEVRAHRWGAETPLGTEPGARAGDARVTRYLGSAPALGEPTQMYQRRLSNDR